jgi:hypothetical protein
MTSPFSPSPAGISLEVKKGKVWGTHLAESREISGKN